MMAAVLIAAMVSMIALANWLIGNVGTVCVPQGPCLIPVGFGLEAPSGVLAIGVLFTLRDILHRLYGVKSVLAAIGIGSVLSMVLAPAPIAVASGMAFLLSEMLDTAVYTPLARRRFLLALIASNLVGALADSAVFLLLAFGSLDFIAGQVAGKMWMTLAALPLVLLARRRLAA